MTDTLAMLANQLEARAKALRGAGDDAALLAAARHAADQIERHRGAPDSDRTEALKVAEHA